MLDVNNLPFAIECVLQRWPVRMNFFIALKWISYYYLYQRISTLLRTFYLSLYFFVAFHSQCHKVYGVCFLCHPFLISLSLSLSFVFVFFWVFAHCIKLNYVHIVKPIIYFKAMPAKNGERMSKSVCTFGLAKPNDARRPKVKVKSQMRKWYRNWHTRSRALTHEELNSSAKYTHSKLFHSHW